MLSVINEMAIDFNCMKLLGYNNIMISEWNILEDILKNQKK
jgi:hypothetical protein